jgi:predicted amidophosphoribosyltransferase
MSALAPISFLRDIATLLYPPVCAICSEPFDGTITTSLACVNCAHRRLYFNAAVSAYRSRGIVRRVILDFTAFDRAERMENLRGAFRLRRNADVRKLRVLLIDDIRTTGSTLSECARVLKQAGARSVYAITAARA